jgi:hypothetical protein
VKGWAVRPDGEKGCPGSEMSFQTAGKKDFFGRRLAEYRSKKTFSIAVWKNDGSKRLFQSSFGRTGGKKRFLGRRLERPRPKKTFRTVGWPNRPRKTLFRSWFGKTTPQKDFSGRRLDKQVAKKSQCLGFRAESAVLGLYSPAKDAKPCRNYLVAAIPVARAGFPPPNPNP